MKDQPLSAKSRTQATAADSMENVSRDGLLPPSEAAFHIGRRPIAVWQAEIAGVLCISALAAFLLFKNLGDQCLWQDEAQTALLAKTILTDGVPRGFDGKNYLSQEFGLEYWGDFPYIYRWHTWLSFYLVAGSFLIFGATTFAARFPCALLGLATVPLVYYFARDLWQNRRAAALAALLLAVNVAFLILSRQCRYYSACAFLMLLGLWAYDRLMQRKPWAAFWFVVAAVLLFHAFYVYWGMLLAAVVVHAAIFNRDRLRAVVGWSGLTLLLVLPWLLWYFWPGNAAVYKDSVADASLYTKLLRHTMTLWQYLTDLSLHVFSPILWAALLLVAVVGAVRKFWWRQKFPWPDGPTVQGCFLLAIVTMVGLLVLTIGTPHYFFRYVAPLVPVLCILAGRILEATTRVWFGFGLVALAVIVMASPMREYAYEITHHLRTPTEAIVECLNENGARPDDVVIITYGDMPLKFYTNLRILGGRTGEDMSAASKARWIIPRRKYPCVAPRDKMVANLIDSILKENAGRYGTPRLKGCTDTPYDNRETPNEHYFWTQEGPPMHIAEIRANEKAARQP